MDEEVTRDVLGEMLILARLMVTGGEQKEDHRMTRADMGLLKRALLEAAKESKLAGSADVLPEQIVGQLRILAEDRPENKARILEMADAMELFCAGFAGQLFNRPGEELPDVDYIRIEMGSLASGNDTNDKLAVAYIAIINQGTIVENTSMKALLKQLDKETLVFDTRAPFSVLPQLADYQLKAVDDHSFEVVINKGQALNPLFAACTAQGIDVISMRNKVNRLEELFVSLVQNHKEEGSV